MSTGDDDVPRFIGRPISASNRKLLEEKLRGKKSRLGDDEESSSQFQIPGPIYFDPDLQSAERELTVEEIFASQPPDLADDIHTIRDDSDGDDEQIPSDCDGDDDEECDASFSPFLLDSARSRKRATGEVQLEHLTLERMLDPPVGHKARLL